MMVLSTNGLWYLDGRPLMQPFTRYVVPDEMGHQAMKIKGIEWRYSDFQNYERRYHGQDLNGGTLAVVRYLGMGDMLITTAFVHYVKALYPDAAIHAYSHPNYSSTVWAKHPDLAIQGCIPLPATLDAMRQYTAHACFDGTMERNAEPDQGNAYDDMFAMMGMYDVPEEYKRPFLAELPQDWGAVNDGLDISGKYIVYVVHTSAPQRNQSWGSTRANIEALCQAFSDHRVLCLSEIPHENDSPDEPNCVWIGRLKEWRHAMPILKHAACVVTPDTGFGHLAAMYPDVPVVSLWAAFSPDSRVKYYRNHHPISASQFCKSAPCWQHGDKLPIAKCSKVCGYVEGCEACPAMNCIEAEQIVEAVKGVISRRPGITLPKPQRLSDYVGRHRDETAWMFGTGPSLDSFLNSGEDIDGISLGVNGAALVMDERDLTPDYVVCHNEAWLQRVAHLESVHVIEKRYAHTVPPTRTVLAYEKMQYDGGIAGPNGEAAKTLLSSSEETIGESAVLYGSSGAAQSALHFLWMTGVRNVRLVGFDPDRDGERAASIDDKGISPATNLYAAIYDELLAEAAILGMTIENVGALLLDEAEK